MPMIGERLHLNLQLYVRALLFNADGVQFASVGLAHIAEGLYSNSSVTMPATAQVKVVYKVYTDSLYTNLSQLHSLSIDLFDLETVDGKTTSHCDLTGYIEAAPDLIGYLESAELVGEIDECNIITAYPPC